MSLYKQYPDFPESPYHFHMYRRQPVVFTKGRGATLWDDKGRRYLDFFAGLAVCGLGHADPRVARAVSDQVRRLLHTSNVYFTEPQARLAEALSKRSFGGKVFFCNSGAEANEGAIKLARRFGHTTPARGKPRYEIIVFEHSFHGRTLATLSATSNRKYGKGFGPLPGGFPSAVLGDIGSVKRKITPRACAVFVEPIQGEGGVHTAPDSFFRALRALCRKHNLLLMFDEVQTGVGRTGKLFAYQHLGFAPDVLALAKGLGNGLPIGAVLAKPGVADLFKPGDHGTTFGGGPVVCRAALAVLEALTPRLLRRVVVLGGLIRKEVESWRDELHIIKEVRGRGLMIGIELDRPGAAVVKFCREQGLLVNCTAERVIRLLPPFCLTDAEARRGLVILKQALRNLAGGY